MEPNEIVEEQNRNDRIMKRALICSVLFFLIGSAFSIYLAYQNIVEYVDGAFDWLAAGNGINVALLVVTFIIAAPFVIIYLLLSFGFTALKVPALIELGVVIMSNLIFFMPYIVKALKHKKE